MTSRFKHYRKVLAIAKVYFDMYDGYTYHVDRRETDPLVRFHFICAQIDEMCRQMRTPLRLELPNGMFVRPSYVPYTWYGHIVRVEVKFDLEMNGVDMGRIKDIVCAYDSFAVDMGTYIIGSGLPYGGIGRFERGQPLVIEIMKTVDRVTRLFWPCWKGTYPLKRGYKGPVLGSGGEAKYTINGIRNTVNKWADIMGVNTGIVQRELDEGADIEEALKEASLIHPSRSKFRRPPLHKGYGEIIYTYKGVSAPLTEWAYSLDMPPKTLQTRMDRGLTFEQAYEMGGSRKIELDGEWKSLSEWCRIYNVDLRKVNVLVRDGLDPKDAILTARLRKVEEQTRKEKEL